MKKLILLTLSSFLFACSSDGDGGNSTECVDFTSDMSASEVENLILNSSYCQQFIANEVELNGAIICQGWYPINDAYGYIFENGAYLQIPSTCVAFGYGGANTEDCNELFVEN
jgi:hypothetical protein